MKRFGLLLAAAVLAGCGGAGGGGGKPSCSATDPCGPGYYCAHTPDGSVCWADVVKPVIQIASFSCSDSPCRRDSALHVTATVSDDIAMGTVSAVLDLDPEHPRTLELVSGADYAVDIPLAEVPFPYFEHAAGVTVKATDEAANADESGCGTVAVTRARWTARLKGAGNTAFPLFSPALLPDGQLVVAGSDGSVHFVSKSGLETRSAVAIGSVVNSPPAVGADAIWLGAQDGTLHKLDFGGSEVSLTDCEASAEFLGPPAVLGDRVVAVSSSVQVIVAKPSNTCNMSNLPAAATTPVAIDSTGSVFVGAGSLLEKCAVDSSSVLTRVWTGISPAPTAPPVGSVSQPLAIDALNAIWTTADAGNVYRTTSSATAEPVVLDPAPSASSTGSVVLADGTVVLGDKGGTLRRAARSGAPSWTTSATLSGRPRIPLALSDAEPSLLVPTSDGWSFAVKASDGAVLWSQKLSNQSLEPANIWTEPGATTSTAYLAGADGNLYAIIVDGALDTSAPWPKAFHDPQNTSNAGVMP
jgi:outer membrane protein assembly factor BamB